MARLQRILATLTAARTPAGFVRLPARNLNRVAVAQTVAAAVSVGTRVGRDRDPSTVYISGRGSESGAARSGSAGMADSAPCR